MPRLRRLLQPKSGRGFVVALDHGFFGRSGRPAGDRGSRRCPRRRHRRRARRRADVGRPGPPARRRRGSADAGAHRPRRRHQPLPVAGPRRERHASTMRALRAVRLDAAALLINLLDADDDPSVRQACLRNVFAAKAECEHYGLPLMVEPIPFERRDGRYHDVADERTPGARWCARPSRPGPTSSRPASFPTSGRCAGRSGSAATCPTSPAAGPRVTTVAVLDADPPPPRLRRRRRGVRTQHLPARAPGGDGGRAEGADPRRRVDRERRGRAVVTRRRAELFLLAVDHRRSFERSVRHRRTGRGRRP